MSAADPLAIAPVVLPFVIGALLLVTEARRPRWQAPVSITTAAALVVVALALVARADAGAPTVTLVGNWPAPYGIVLFVDRLAALMVALVALVGLAAALASTSPTAGRGPHFHGLLQVQLAGLAGAFLTADIFNLFVCFELLLIASYALLLHGADSRAVRPGLRYVAVNLVASAFFLIAAAAIYAASGTLNLADFARRWPALTGFDAALARAGVWALIGVFAVKAALLPLGFWLAPTYRAAPVAVALVFAVMTKVGVYAILRIGAALGAGTGDAIAVELAAPLYALGLATVAAGVLSALAARELAALVAALVVVSSGVLVAAIASGPGAWGGAIVYAVHSTIVAALLFLVAGTTGVQRGDLRDRTSAGPVAVDRVLLGSLWVVGGAAAAGFPPFGGFVGKFLVLSSTAGAGVSTGLWFALLGSGGFLMLAFARAGATVFWAGGPPLPQAPSASPGERAALVVLAAATLALIPAAGPLVRYASAAAQALGAPAAAFAAVLDKRPVDSKAGRAGP